MKMDEHARAWGHEFVSGLLNNAAVTPEQRSGLHWEIVSHLHEAAERRVEARGGSVITLPDLQAVVQEMGGPAGISAAFLETRVVATGRAGFGRRVGAFVIDAFIGAATGGMVAGMMGAMAAIIGLPFGAFGLVPLTFFALWYGYLVLMEARFGATVGKMALKLRTVMADGRPLTLEAAFIRNIAKVVPPLLVIDVLVYLLAFSKDDQRASDRVANTIVIDTTKPTWSPGLAPPPMSHAPPAPVSTRAAGPDEAREMQPPNPRTGIR